MAPPPIVVKVGGSLYDLPDLGVRLRNWLATLPAAPVLLVPGGGAAVDAVRELDRCHHLGEEAAHWLALRALTVNAHVLAKLLAPVQVIDDPWAVGDGWSILDCHAFLLRDEREPDGQTLPHSWFVTSDSIAARAAAVCGANRLVLLKSVTIPPNVDWHEAARRGWVDEVFPSMIECYGCGFLVTCENLRERIIC